MDNKQFDEILLKVPGSFKANLERIRRYLHLGKASVMVGAGFSCNADVPPHIKVKQWSDIGKDIYCRLMAVDEVDPAKLEFKTPMRLASQFAASYGQSELDALIKDSIPDDRMSPGALHRQLLELPWRDVFTTNYDTLLERSRKGLRRSYSVVTSREMLLYNNSPRIIKLHGSFPDRTPFLMTEEDFRTYPMDHPEFVNTVRQALVESVFCLIGFSGDDPNFISWQGWLRDVMGDYAGPSYLITCDKDYDESFKTLMEHRGIQVLNFSEIPGLDNYQVALDFFFSYLSERESAWCGFVDYDSRKVDVPELIKRFKQIRQTYPGWFILPKKHIREFDDMIHVFPCLDTAFQTIKEEDKEALLFELDWRADISLTFKDHDWYREAIEQVIREYDEAPLTAEAITLGISLLRLYRHHPEGKLRAEVLKDKLKRERGRMTPYQQSCFYYTVACNALSVLDYETVETTLMEWDVSHYDYVGTIYKAVVLAESSDVSAASQLLGEAYETITQSLTQTTTQEELSLRCIIAYLLAFYSGERKYDNDSRFSFSELSDYIQRQASEVVRDQFEIKHGFGIGSSTKSWNIGPRVETNFFYPYRYLLLCERYGLPYGLTDKVLGEKILSVFLPQMVKYGLGYSFGVVMRSGSRTIVRAYMNRKALMMLTRDEADRLAGQLLATSKLNSCEKAREYRSINVLLPFLARLSSLCSVSVVVEIYRFVLLKYCKSRYAQPEDLNIIYGNVMPDGIQNVYEEAFLSGINLSLRNSDIPLPYIGLNFYAPGDKEISIVCEGLKSEDNQIKDAAYCRAKRLLRSNLSEDGKKQLFGCIRLWRTDTTNIMTRASFLLVPPIEEELDKLHAQIEQDLSDFLAKDYKYEGSSVSISSLNEKLSALLSGVPFMSKEQVKMVLTKLSDVLKTNHSAFSTDDSKEWLGGLRHFTKRTFDLIGDIIRLAVDKGFDDDLSSGELLKALTEYLRCHLPVRITIERLNRVARSISANRMREILEKDLFSDNEVDVIDSCNGLISYIQHSAGYQKVLQRIIFYCNYAETDQMQLYLQTLAQIPIEKLSMTTQLHLASMMKELMERIAKRNLAEEQKIDILHDGVRLAASLRGASAGSPLADAVEIWAKYANDEKNFNDIRLPWFVAE